MINLCQKSHPRQRTIRWVVNKRGCFEVTSHKTDDSGYAVGIRKGKHVKLHRYLYELKHGPIGEGLVLLHECDNRICVNPAHLKPGTHQENMDDMVSKGRSAKGSKVASSKLNNRQVSIIKRSKKSARELADRYGVHVSTIYRVRNGTHWQ